MVSTPRCTYLVVTNRYRIWQIICSTSYKALFLIQWGHGSRRGTRCGSQDWSG